MTLLLLLSLVGCTDDATSTLPADSGGTPTDTGGTSDTGGTTDTVDTQDTTPPCTITVRDTEPQSDEDEVFWRDPLRVWFDGSFHDRALPSLSLTLDADRSAVAFAAAWDDGVDSVVLTPDAPLQPSSGYTLTVDACDQTWAVPFTTGTYGSGVDAGPESLVDRTWVLEMGRVAWTEPEGAGDLMSVFFTDPLLIGVTRYEAGVIDLLVGMGDFTDLDGFIQLKGQGTWDVPDVALSDAGWFTGQAESIVFRYQGVEVPVHGFALQGTFAPDGSSIGGASIQGLVDTRTIPLLFNLDQPDFICTTYAADYGLECTLCPDDELLCLDLKGEDVTLDEQPGLVLERNDQG